MRSWQCARAEDRVYLCHRRHYTGLLVGSYVSEPQPEAQVTTSNSWKRGEEERNDGRSPSEDTLATRRYHGFRMLDLRLRRPWSSLARFPVAPSRAWLR